MCQDRDLFFLIHVIIPSARFISERSHIREDYISAKKERNKMSIEEYNRTLKYILQGIWVDDSSKILEKYLEHISEYPSHIQQLINFLHSTAITRSSSSNVTKKQADIEMGIVALTLISVLNALSRPESDTILSNEQEVVFLKLLRQQEDESDPNKK